MRIIFVPLVLLAAASLLPAQKASELGHKTGKEIFQATCVGCHGPDAKGQPITVRGFAQEPPDFTDCNATTREAKRDWISVIHRGGPARSFSQIMPAFDELLTDQEIGLLAEYFRTFCDPSWPQEIGRAHV